MRRALIPGLLLFLATAAHAQKAKPTEPIEPDRPDFTNGSSVVPVGWLQIEAGGTLSFPRHERDLSGPEAFFRYGLSPSSELRLGLSDYNLAWSRGRRAEGFGDTYVGAKFRVGKLPGDTNVALIPGAFLPDGSRGYSSGGFDPELQLCLDRSLGGPWSLGAMEYGAWRTVDGRREFAFQQTLSLERDLGRGLSAFVEYAGTFSRDARADHLAHTGLAYRLSQNSQVDLHGGESLGSDRRPFVGAGYAVRF